MYRNNTGYSTSELVSRVFTGAMLPFNFAPKKLYEIDDQKKLNIFFSIGSFNSVLHSIQHGLVNKFEFIKELKFDDEFRKAITTQKARKASDEYLTWFKMCCHLKFLFKDDNKGLEFFKLFSKLSEKYDEKKCEKFYEECKPTFGSISGVFSIIDKFVPPSPELNRKELVKKTFFKN